MCCWWNNRNQRIGIGGGELGRNSHSSSAHRYIASGLSSPVSTPGLYTRPNTAMRTHKFASPAESTERHIQIDRDNNDNWHKKIPMDLRRKWNTHTYFSLGIYSEGHRQATMLTSTHLGYHTHTQTDTQHMSLQSMFAYTLTAISKMFPNAG